MYYRGNLAEFNIWHDAAKLAESIPPEGKIGFVNGLPAPNSQRTMAYSEAVSHPSNIDDYLWIFGAYPSANKTALTYDDAVALGWFPQD